MVTASLLSCVKEEKVAKIKFLKGNFVTDNLTRTFQCCAGHV